MIHFRHICPVGQGGFSIEAIGNMTIVYDCGSLSNKSMLESCIDALCRKRSHVDYLFLSHFDKDHVNSLRFLLNRIKVYKAVISYIPSNIRVAYNVYTDNAYNTISAILRDSDTEINEVEGGEGAGWIGKAGDIWEWIAKSMMNPNDFVLVEKELKSSLNIANLQNPQYMEMHKGVINKAFKKAFGAQGPNAKGLIMLSQHCKGVGPWESSVIAGCCYHEHHICNVSNTSCLYVGDADLKNKSNMGDVKSLLYKSMTDSQLELLQIPHHGSSRNSSSTLDQDIPADIYFVNDKDSNRLQKNSNLFRSLINSGKLHVVRGECIDLLITVSRF